MRVNFKKTHPNAQTPSLGSHEGKQSLAVGYDVTVVELLEVLPLNDTTYKVTYDTGLAIEDIKDAWVSIVARSSIHKYGLSLANALGVIDPDYRGTIKAVFYFHDLAHDSVHPEEHLEDLIGKRLLQLIPIPIYPETLEFVEVDKLSETSRGTRGFGSTGE